IYKGLDIVTAKATAQERSLVAHHLLDILEPHQMFTVVDFRNRALSIIDNLSQQGKIPLVVGGTNYYVESIVYNILVEDADNTNELLWDSSKRKRDFENVDDEIPESTEKRKIVDATDEKSISKPDDREGPSSRDDESGTNDLEVTKEALQEFVDNEKKFTNEEVHDKLRLIDPVQAGRLHPNNRRKVLRSIEVWLHSGRRHSEVLAEQRGEEGRLRHPGATLVLWLKCEQSVHDSRLDARVDAMLRAGLLQELEAFHRQHNLRRILSGQPPDYTKGIFQTLGFKEFHEYLMLPEEEKSSEQGQKLLEMSIDNMKMATRRYARRQNKMTMGRFLEHPNREIPPIYELDTTNIELWDTEVREKAIHIVESFLNGEECRFQPLKSQVDDERKNDDENSYNYCNVCERIIIGDRTYRIHMKSNKHKKVLKKKNEEAKKNQDVPK
ncbi:hypothetical protein JYU34_021422, partial [Plutella xylostella]